MHHSKETLAIVMNTILTLETFQGRFISCYKGYWSLDVCRRRGSSSAAILTIKGSLRSKSKRIFSNLKCNSKILWQKNRRPWAGSSCQGVFHLIQNSALISRKFPFANEAASPGISGNENSLRLYPHFGTFLTRNLCTLLFCFRNFRNLRLNDSNVGSSCEMAGGALIEMDGTQMVTFKPN